MKINYDVPNDMVIRFDTECIAGSIVGDNLYILPGGSAVLNELQFISDVMGSHDATVAGSGKTAKIDDSHDYGVLAMGFKDSSYVYLVKCEGHDHTVCICTSNGKLDEIDGIKLTMTYADRSRDDIVQVPEFIRVLSDTVSKAFVERLGPNAVNFSDGLATIRNDFATDSSLMDDLFSEADKALIKSFLYSDLN